MMKCLIINGGPNKTYLWAGKPTTSFTSKLVDEVKAEMSRLGEVSFQEVRLMDANIPYCLGCMNCFYKGEEKCPHASLVQPIMQALKEVDCVIMTSPVYALNVSALVKGFFDHTAYNYHRPSLFDKKGLTISSTAGGMAKRNCQYMRETLMHWGVNSVHTLPVVRMGASDVSEKIRAQCQRAARALYHDTASGTLKGPSFKNIFYYQLWRNMSKTGAPDAADRLYWKDSGLVDHVYSPLVKVAPPKRAFGAMINRLFGLIMKP